jgi:23S rRNA (guanosine2251-2'-O)-methyltransferase
MMPDIRILLHDIRSAHNVGSIFRTSDAMGVSRIYLSGYTPSPTDRFGRKVKEIAKTALGAEESIPWEYERTPTRFLAEAKSEGFVLVGLEQDTRAKDYKKFQQKNKTLILLGSEVSGLSNELRDMCDELVEIPMRGEKESLNVAVSFGIALFRMFDR